jgi:hypothetical protein
VISKTKKLKTVGVRSKVKTQRKAVPSRSAKGRRPVAKGRVLTVDLTPVVGRLMFGVSEKYVHPEVILHRIREGS